MTEAFQSDRETESCDVEPDRLRSGLQDSKDVPPAEPMRCPEIIRRPLGSEAKPANGLAKTCSKTQVSEPAEKVRAAPLLGSPMYYFLDNLVFCYYSVNHPKILVNFFSHCKTIAYQGYMAQLFFLHLLGVAKVMAYDCYMEHLPTSALYQAQIERGLLHPDLQHLQPLLFVLILLIYLITLIGNSLIIAVMVADLALITPMYFFLRNLSVLEICYTSVVIPKTLTNLLSERQAISFLDCAC
ncbi:unnamed protein product [Caretta caretta]